MSISFSLLVEIKMARIVLLGAGHAQLYVLKHFAECRNKNLFNEHDFTLISPSSVQYYSGMLPGVIAGHYALGDCQIDVSVWAERAGAVFIQDTVIHLDADNKCIQMLSGIALHYDFLSICTGSETDLSDFNGGSSVLIPFKPIEAFLHSWSRCIASPPRSIAVLGGGAGGFELVCAIQTCLQQHSIETQVKWVVGNRGLLSDFPKGLQIKAASLVSRLNIQIIQDRATVKQNEPLLNKSGHVLDAEVIVVATGPSSPKWLQSSGLQLSSGYIVVDEYHRSLSHSSIVAAGDVCHRNAAHWKRSGVYAVRAGPYLAKNLEAMLLNQSLKPYLPQKRALYLLSCGRKVAFASWGRGYWHASWLWELKSWIDRSYIQSFR